MKFSVNWLNSYFKNIPNWDDVFYKLTMAGIEVEGIEEDGLDKVVEFKITPNRGDALSIRGLLREIMVLTESDITNFPGNNVEIISSIPDKMAIDVINKESCPNYCSLIIKDINNQVKLPAEIIECLIKSGNKSVSPVVDITNYVMLELGQPLHAFDLDKVGDKLSIRYAKENETLELLANSTVNLTKNSLLVCDANDRPAAIAGVMGGLNSALSETTQSIVLESAFFMPDVIAGMAKHYGVNSDSAYRFERGVDSSLQETAIKYAAMLIVKYCGGKVGQIVEHSTTLAVRQVKIDYSTIGRLIGISIDKNKTREILTKLGFVINDSDDGSIAVSVPSHRHDITIKEDVIEEIARIYGYDNIEAQIPITRYTMEKSVLNNQSILKSRLVNIGYNEIISYAFVEEKMEALFGNPEYKAIKLHNPIANLNSMRTSLIGGLVNVLENNVNRGHKRAKLFELARVFYGEKEDLQRLKIAGLIYGNHLENSWYAKSRMVDFYDLRSDIEVLLSGFGELKFLVCRDNSVFHSGRCAKIVFSDKEIGIIGQLHPRYKSKFDFTDLPYVFELDIDSIVNAKRAVFIREISHFQKVERDLAFVVELSTNIGDILDKISGIEVPYLVKANVFDIYDGEKLVDIRLNGKAVKSVAINFTFHANKTLNDEEINASIIEIKQCVEGNFLAQLRT